MDTLKRTVGNGLLLSEGEIWARQRKILYRIFNFDYLKSQAPKIAEICDFSIKETEAVSSKRDGRIVQYHIFDLTSRMFSNSIMECFLGVNLRKA